MNHRRATIVIVTGPPGAGKTTLSHDMAQQSVVPAVHLHADDFWQSIKSGYIAPYDPQADRQNGVVMAALAQCAQAYAAGGYWVFVDGIIGPWFADIFGALSLDVHYLVLRPSLAECVQRCQDRKPGALSDPQVIGALYRQFERIGAYENYVLETVDLAPEEIKSRIRNAVDSGRFVLDRRMWQGQA